MMEDKEKKGETNIHFTTHAQEICDHANSGLSYCMQMHSQMQKLSKLHRLAVIAEMLR